MGGFGAEQSALDVDGHLLVEGIAQLVLGEVGKGDELVEYASVAHEDVELTESAQRLSHGCLVVLQPGDIAVEDSHFLPELAA